MKGMVIGSKETIKVNVQGNIETYVVYTYMVNDFGPFTVELPKTADSREAVEAEIQKKVAILEGLTGVS